MLPAQAFGKEVFVSIPLSSNPGQDDHQLLSALENQRRLLKEKITAIAALLRTQTPSPSADARKQAEKVKEVRTIQLHGVVCEFAKRNKELEAQCYTAQRFKEECEHTCESLRAELDNTTQKLRSHVRSSTCKCICKCGARDVQGPDLSDESVRKLKEDLVRLKADLDSAGRFRTSLEEQNVKLTAELRVSEERFLSTRAFKKISKQCQNLIEHVNRLKGENEDLRKEKDGFNEMLASEIARTRRVEEVRREELERKYQELTFRCEREVMNRQAAQAELEGIRKEHTGVIRLKETEGILTTRETEIESLKKRYKDLRTLREDLETKAELDFQRIQDLQDALALKEYQMSVLQAQIHEEKPASCQVPEDETALQVRISHYKEEILRVREHAKKLEIEVAGQKSRLSHMQTKLTNEKSNFKKLIEDMDCTGKAYDEAMKQNKTFLQKTKDHDQTIAKIMSERISEDRSKHLLEAEAKKFKERVDAQAGVIEAQKAIITQIETAKIDLESTVVRYIQKLLQNKLKDTESKIREVDARCASDLRTHDLLESIQRQATEQCHDFEKLLVHTATEAAQTKFQYAQAEEDLNRLKTELLQHQAVDRLQPSDAVLTEELMKYRRMTRCGACAVRLKEVLISKCFHAFCRPCLEARLSTKDHDCPICRHQFSETEIKEIWW